MKKYVEVDREPVVGDLVKIVYCDGIVPTTNGKPEYEVGHILRIIKNEEGLGRYRHYRYANGTADNLKERILHRCEFVVVEEIKDNTTKDNINPNHYKSSCSLECIDAMQMAFGKTMVYDFCICNAWKYLWRYENKNGIEDVNKSKWYIDKAKELDEIHYEANNIEEILNKIIDRLMDK